MYKKTIEQHATDVIAMEERATCRFSEQSTIDSHIEIVKSNVKRLVQALAELEDDTTALQDHYIQRAVYIGARRGNEECKVLSDRITDIRMEQRRKEREEQERREDLELLQDILFSDVKDLCEEDVEDMYELEEKYDEFMTKEQHARFQEIHLILANLAEDKETAFVNDLYQQMLEESEEQYHANLEENETHTPTPTEGKTMIKISFIDSKGIKNTTEYTSKELYEMRLQLCFNTLEELGFYSIGESIEYGLTSKEEFEAYEDDLHTCRKNNTLEEFSTYDYRRALRTLKHIQTILEEGY